MKRICIYLTYDKQKIIDSYIGYMLSELKTCVEYLAVVCNMTEITCGLDILEKYADKVFYRENIGFDAGGFKEALCNYIGWKKILEYDELVLVNDSLFGPFKPMKSIFAEMDNCKVDYWGLATHGANGDNILKHIQSYFLVIRSRMLHSVLFKKYWEDMPFYVTFLDVVYQHEVKFTSYFKRLGYTYDTLADLEVNDSKITLKNNYIQYSMLAYELIKKRNFPFLKKQPLAYNTLLQQTQENLHQAINYIDENTDYDVNFIWDNIIRTLNMTDLQRSLHLQYIISSEKEELMVEKSRVIVIFATHKNAAEYIFEYIEDMEQGLDCIIQVISENDEILGAYRERVTDEKKLILRSECDWMDLCKYDFVCVLHDVDMSSDILPSCTAKSYFYSIWENLFKDKDHILGILGKFEKEERLGFLAPAQPDFADYFGDLGYGWNEKYKVIVGIVNRLQLHCPISEEKPPFRITDNFWIRGNILQCLEKLKPDEYSYLPYLWSYFAQHKGYYSGIVESIDYASMHEVNMQYYLRQITGQVKRQYGDFRNFGELQEFILIGALNIFCAKYSKILIYGTGYYAKKYIKLLKNVEGCIVSDGQDRISYFEGIPVMYLSEVKTLKECGIVLCLNRENQKVVIPFLERCGVKDYFCIF